ncbi:MAG TPA: iron-sulfur cluster assembly accessory protein [Planctomycetaceae bacterium]
MNRILASALLATAFLGCAEGLPLPKHESVEEGESDPVVPLQRPAGRTEPSNRERRNVVMLTEAAADKVREFQRQQEGSLLRVSVEGDGSTGFLYDLRLDDEVGDKDIFGDSHGVSVVVDRSSAFYLEGTTIDWRTTPDGRSGFWFDNPNALPAGE